MKPSKTMMVVFLLPAILVFALIFVYPSLRTIGMSFFKVASVTDASSKWSFVGLENYATIFSDKLSLQSFVNIFKIWSLGGVLVMALSMIFAGILTSGIKGKSFYRSVMYLPNVIPVIAWGTVWLQAVYSQDYGLLKNFFSFIGFQSLAQAQWTSKDNIFLAMLAAYSVNMVGYYVLVFVAGIDRIPKDYYEAASIEGAGRIRSFFEITLPLMRDIIRTSITLWSIGVIGFFVWTQVFSRFQVTLETATPMAYMYQIVFGREFVVSNPDLINAGLGAAFGVVMTVLVVLAFLILTVLIPTSKDVEF